MTLRTGRAGLRAALLAPLLLPAAAGMAAAQDAQDVRIDTIAIEREDVFPRDSADAWFQRTMNNLHVVTNPEVVRRELLVRTGDSWDQALVDESERNLRSRGLFADVALDSVRLPDGRLMLRVRTVDAWTTSPKISYSVAGDGTTTSIFGVTESNLLGTGTRVQLWRRKDVDRSGLDVAARVPRLFGSRVNVEGAFADLSDQNYGSWRVAAPFESLSQDHAVEYDGEAFDGRIPRYRTVEPAVTDTTEFFRRAVVHRLTISLAPIASSRGYVRVGAIAELRNEEILTAPDPGALVPDTVYGAFGTYVEWRDAEYDSIRYFNAFSVEDRDLSEVVKLTLMLAPGGWGYPHSGIGPRLDVSAGRKIGSGFVRAEAAASALWTSAGTDSSRVTAEISGGMKPGERHATLARVGGGALRNPAPGEEFDYGFQTPPRLWDPHAFTGDRSLYGSLEHRWYAWDSVLDVVGLGFGAFADYAGAWYSDQDRRLGGSAGFLLIFGSALAAVPATGTLSLGWRVGEDGARSDFAVSFVGGLQF